MKLYSNIRVNGSPELPQHQLSSKLLHRFYEPLGLLSALGKTRGEHTSRILPSHEQVDSFSASELTRRFLDELAFLCDYKKGGDTVTAIALGQTPQGYIFWVAANKCPKQRILPFLKALLLLLKDNAVQQDDEFLVGQIFRLSVEFARARIETYARFLSSDLDRLKKFTACADVSIASSMKAWKDALGQLDLHSLVDFAYENRHSTFMHQLADLANNQHYKSSRDSLQATCASTRHNIGRLGLHARSARTLARCAPRAIRFLDSYTIRPVSVSGKGNGRPPPRAKTTMAAALGRMVSGPNSGLEMYQAALAQMDGMLNISQKFQKDYGDAKNKTRVHAEVQVLDHLHRSGADFYANDRYIACSKPACFCCLLYFRHHPGGYIEPRSHYKIYLNWQPPGLTKLEERTSAEAVLNLMVRDIRRDALRQILERAGPRVSHPDSVTGISASVLAAHNLDDVGIVSETSGYREVGDSVDGEYDSVEKDDNAVFSAFSELGLDSEMDSEEGGISLL